MSHNISVSASVGERSKEEQTTFTGTGKMASSIVFRRDSTLDLDMYDIETES